jgi:hypothetical protein
MKNSRIITSTLLAITLLSACSLPSWSTYTNATYQFELQYPSSGSLVTDTPNAARIQLPIQSGTNLVESYMDIAVQEGAMPCLSPYGDAYAPPPGTLVTDEGIIGGEYFVVERASEGAAGTLYDWIAYSTANATDCVSLTFVLVSTHPEAHPTPVPAFDMDIAEALFLSIVNTFTWLVPTFTPLPPIPTFTPTPAPNLFVPSFTPTFAPYQFIPKFNAHCRSGPDMAFSSITLAMQGQSYPIDGRNRANTWLYIITSPQVGCWVPIEDGTASMDTSAVRVLAEIPTPTFTTIPFSCAQFNSPQTCSQHTECTWNRLVFPGVCQNK